MSDISKIDANFAESGCIKGGNFISIDKSPFKIYGLMKDENGYCRVPRQLPIAQTRVQRFSTEI